MNTENMPLRGFEVVGLSISQCILAIVEGKIPEHLVTRIEGGSCFADPADLGREYGQKCWQADAPAALAVLDRLIREGKLVQPRLEGKPAPDTSGGIWRFGTLQMGTEELQDLLAISDAFLHMPAEGREGFIDILPQAALQEMVRHLKQGHLEGFFPEFAKASANQPAHKIFELIKDRLKEFFRSTPEHLRASIYPALMQILGPFFRTFHQEGPRPAQADGLSPQFSRYLPPSGKKPPKG